MTDQNQTEQSFSDMLSDRYKTFLKKTEQGIQSETEEKPADTFVGNNLKEKDNIFSSQLLKKEDDNTKNDFLTVEDKFALFFKHISENDEYPSNEDLLIKYNFTKNDINALISYKYTLVQNPDLDIYTKLSLPGEDGKNLFLRKKYAMDKALSMFNTYIDQNSFFKADNFIDNMISNLIYSEIQNTYDAQGLQSSKQRIEIILSKESPSNESEQLVVNLYNAYTFIISNEISEETLFQLYKILTQALHKSVNLQYRSEDSTIYGQLGEVIMKTAPPQRIDILLKKMFTYIDFSFNTVNSADAFVSSLICFYYMIYICPYKDYNMMLSRMFATWYIIKHPNISSYKPLFISEAIYRDEKSGKMLKAIKDSFNSRHDITYFVDYMINIISSFSMITIKLSKISDICLSNGFELSKAEEKAIKSILLIPNVGKGFFDWQKFKEYDQSDFSKQYYNKLLNHLVEKEVLTSVTKNSKLYMLDYVRFNI